MVLELPMCLLVNPTLAMERILADDRILALRVRPHEVSEVAVCEDHVDQVQVLTPNGGLVCISSYMYIANVP